jgi:murein L,D-transpeptidase YcbB/YkuD
VDAVVLSTASTLRRFYRGRAYQLAWTHHGTLLPPVEALLSVLREAEHEGLRAAEYHLPLLEDRLTELRRGQEEAQSLSPPQLVALDLLLTDAFLLYGSHLSAGRLDPAGLKLAQFGRQPEVDLAQVLHTALATDQIAAALRGLQPPHADYLQLRQALARYRSLAAQGGWPVVPPGPTLHEGDRNSRVSVVRRRLRVTGELVPGVLPDQEELFDEGLTQAVKRFQARHGVDGDGVVGPATLAALNVPVATRLRQLEVNLDRWRWLPRALGSPSVVVNVANFSLVVVEHGRPVLPLRVVVGKPSWRTPLFSATLTALVVNPSWQVPHNIAVREVLPALRKDRQYLTKHHLQVRPRGAAQAHALPPATIPWAATSAQPFPYRFWQAPGPTNPLGRLKFVLPNPFDIYLHDTSSPALFGKTVRAFSHGCIRVDNPVELAQYLLRAAPAWSGKALQTAIAQGRERMVPLPQPLPVYIVYWTAWVDEEGVLQFRPDIYETDRKMAEALQKVSAVWQPPHY